MLRYVNQPLVSVSELVLFSGRILKLTRTKFATVVCCDVVGFGDVLFNISLLECSSFVCNVPVLIIIYACENQTAKTVTVLYCAVVDLVMSCVNRSCAV